MAKGHIENRRTGKTWCGREMPRDFNPWTTNLETCERCLILKEKDRLKTPLKERAKPIS